MTPSQEKYQRERLAFAEFIKLYPLTIEDLDGEEWRPIEGYEGYQISNFGRVKSFKNNSIRILKPRLTPKNYLCVRVQNGQNRALRLHRLVAKLFVPNPANKPQVNHRDGCKFNACAANLEWVTAAENIQHAFRTGLHPVLRGEATTQSKLTKAQVLYIRENPQKLSLEQLAIMFNVTDGTISDVQRGLRYKNVSGTIRQKYPNRVPQNIRDLVLAEYQKGVVGHGREKLAKKFGLSPSMIRKIVTGK